MGVGINFVVDLSVLQEAMLGGRRVVLPFEKAYRDVLAIQKVEGDLTENTFLYRCFDTASSGLSSRLIREVSIVGSDQKTWIDRMQIDPNCAIVTLDERTMKRFEDIDEVHAHITGLLRSENPMLGSVSPVSAIAFNRGEAPQTYSSLPLSTRAPLP